MSPPNAFSTFADFMSARRFDEFTTLLQSVAMLSGLVLPLLFAVARPREIHPRILRAFAVYVLALTLLGTAVVGMWHFFVAIPFGVIGITAYLDMVRSPGGKRGRIAPILFVVGAVEFFFMGWLTTEAGNTWGAGPAPFAIGFCAQALSLVFLALFHLRHLRFHGLLSAAVLLLAPFLVWPFRLRGLYAEFPPSGAFVAYMQLLCYSLWFSGLVYLAMCLLTRHWRKPESVSQKVA